MKILVDECLPSELCGTLTEKGHQCQTVRQAGFGSKKNGELLTIAEGRWEVLLWPKTVNSFISLVLSLLSSARRLHLAPEFRF